MGALERLGQGTNRIGAIPILRHRAPTWLAHLPILVNEAEREAEECFLKAIEVARRQQAKSLELWATVSLAHLWQQQGKRLRARNTLATIYNWFTEGFDTVDLKEAKALLEELAG
jgi:predicted ATPase